MSTGTDTTSPSQIKDTDVFEDGLFPAKVQKQNTMYPRFRLRGEHGSRISGLIRQCLALHKRDFEKLQSQHGSFSDSFIYLLENNEGDILNWQA